MGVVVVVGAEVTSIFVCPSISQSHVMITPAVSIAKSMYRSDVCLSVCCMVIMIICMWLYVWYICVVFALFDDIALVLQQNRL